MSEMQRKIGIILPSSNTIVEPRSYELISWVPGVSLHFARLPVVRIEANETSFRQFAWEAFDRACDELLSAEVDELIWNGTSGGWLGVDWDQTLSEHLTSVAKRPVITAFEATIEATKALCVRTVSLVTPYIEELNQRIMRNFAAMAIDVIKECHLNLTQNTDFARISSNTILTCLQEVDDDNAQASVIFCTNMNGSVVVRTWERQSHKPVIDSVQATLWWGLKRLDVSTTSLTRYGQLFGR
ncbi:maleate isomerase [Sulfobacillus thermosulfidooxidans DSM 9293]|uniref:Maleate isomerase n=2 Tax=Sulfobacillus thermosulfidooxidans TaxID=28034 RepID=A0A1W1WHJ5_SULTA|nr:maleate isomerase [Sulfobacillus thermosulfidooxidans DSM 9293]